MEVEEYTSIKKQKNRKTLFLVFLVAATTIVFIVSTYAWFIGTDSVRTTTFTLGVSSADGLELSLDGSTWESTLLTIDKNAILGISGTHKAYGGNTNIWPEFGLNPISTKGEVDSTIGRLKLYGKSAMTSTSGGFRFTSDQIDNSITEQEGYIAFDLFIRNGMGVDYIVDYNQADDEAVYLTRDSSVVVSAEGAQTEDYGLANSIRLAFMQVGRVKSDTSQVSSITGIVCTTSSTNTGLCSNVVPTIWEPNNKDHNQNLITYFNNVCNKRTGMNTYSNAEDDSCVEVVSGVDNDTYVVKEEISSATKTDIYDGNNSYTSSLLENIDTFTDSRKMIKDLYRNTFFYLAPNSITKMRVYVYLEGQDLDNYDAISTNHQISINFGFTKNINSTETGTYSASLQDYTWHQIKEISQKLVAGTLSYSAMQSNYGISIGDTKKATINGEEHKFRLIGVLSDVDEDGENIGMTFEQVDLMNTSYAMDSSMSSSDSWNDSTIYSTINSYEVYEALDDYITPAKKAIITNVSDDTITYETSKLWLLSEKEISDSSTNTYSNATEGSAYSYYTDAEYSTNSRMKRQNGTKTNYWLRSGSSSESSSSSFVSINKDGSITSSLSTQTKGVALCFGI